MVIFGYKTFKVITTKKRKCKLVLYFKKWKDLNNLISRKYKIKGKMLN